MRFRWINVILLLLTLWVLFLVYNKMVNREPQSTAEITPSRLTTEFLNFYDTFHADSIFQMQHIDFPLEGMEKDSTGIRDIFWTAEEWVLHKPMMELSDYNRSYAVNPRLVVEIVEDRSKVFKMERRFFKDDGTWELIYYEEMGPRRSE